MFLLGPPFYGSLGAKNKVESLDHPNDKKDKRYLDYVLQVNIDPCVIVCHGQHDVDQHEVCCLNEEFLKGL